MTNQELLLKTTYECRGKIIQLVTEMEVMIDKFIAEYFIEDEDKQMELINLIISSQVGLTAKNSIFEYLLYQNKENKKEDIRLLVKNIDAIIAERNVFAHWPVNLSQESETLFFAEQKLTFMKLKTGKHKGIPELAFEKQFSETQMNLLMQSIDGVNNTLRKLIHIDTASPSVPI